MAQHLIEMQKAEHANIGGVQGKKIFIFDNAGKQVTSFGGNVTVAGGEVGVAAGESYIGLATVDIGSSLPEGEAFIGLATVNLGSPIPSGAAYVGLATVDIGTSPTLTVDATGQGDVPVTLDSEAVSLDSSSAYVGLVTVANNVSTLNNGPAYTVYHKPINMSVSSIATIESSLAGRFRITNIMLNSNSSVRVAIKSGPTYILGNASIGVTLNPGGGWVENGSPDSPLYEAITTTAGLVVEKWEDAGWVSNLCGHVAYYEVDS